MPDKQVLVPFVLAAAIGTSGATQQSLGQLPSGLREAVFEATYGVVPAAGGREGAVYPLQVDPWLSTLEALLWPSVGQNSDHFGYSADIDGDTAIVGANEASHGGKVDAGAAYVFVRSGTTWSEQAKLTASDAAADDHFGESVAIWGDALVVGAPGFLVGNGAGQAYVFVRSGTTWSEQAKLTASDAAADDHFGTSVAIWGDTVVVGTPYKSGTFPLEGVAYVFVRLGTVWSEQQKLTAIEVNNAMQFGQAVAIERDTTVIGAPYDTWLDMARAGSAHVFTRGGTVWTPQARLTASEPVSDGLFGNAISVSGDTVLIGSKGDLSPFKGGAVVLGWAYAFVRSGTIWTQQQQLAASDGEIGDFFGTSVAVHGDTAVVGAYDDNHATNSGSAYVFVRSGSTWVEQEKLEAATSAYRFGQSVGISGDTLVVGTDSFPTAPVHVYRNSIVPPASYCTAGTSASGCQALLSASGVPSATAASGFSLVAATVEGQKDGLFFFGTNGQQATPWGNSTSYQCVVPPVVRTSLLTGTGTAGLCDGSFALDLNALWCPTCPKPAKNPGAAAVVQAQLWYRDPLSTSNQTTSLSDAIEFVVGP